MALPVPLRIGTRGSPLALKQVDLVREALIAAVPTLAEPGRLETVVISTQGDRILDRALSAIGGKGLFTEEIEAGLLQGHLHLAVHSMKDMPTALPDGLVIAAMLPREDVRDAWIGKDGVSLADLSEGAVVGTASLRRQAQLRALRPDLAVITFRGNVQTRLRKLNEGEVAATMLAYAGLRRLGTPEVASAVLEPETMLPAVAQGAIGIECRADADELRALLHRVHHISTGAQVAAERALLGVLDGSCRTPIAAYAAPQGDDLHLRALIAAPDGQRVWHDAVRGAAAEAEALGRDLGARLRAAVGESFMAALRESA